MAPSKKPPEGKIVEATGAAVASKNPNIGKALEEAMVQAIKDASDEGIVDPKIVKERMLKARADKMLEISKENEAPPTP